MVSADGGHPGTNTSTGTNSWTGREYGNNGGTTWSGMPGSKVTFSRYARSYTSLLRNGLRIPGTLEVTAQSPSDTKIFVRSRTIFILCRSSSLLTAPSTRVMSTVSGKILASTNGL